MIMKKHQITLFILLFALGGCLSYNLMPLMKLKGDNRAVCIPGPQSPGMTKLGLEQKVVANVMHEHPKMVLIMMAKTKNKRSQNEYMTTEPGRGSAVIRGL